MTRLELPRVLSGNQPEQGCCGGGEGHSCQERGTP